MNKKDIESFLGLFIQDLRVRLNTMAGITGKQIKDGSIDTEDLNDESVSLRTLQPEVVALLGSEVGCLKLAAQGQSLAESSSNASSYQSKLSVTATLKAGLYRIGWCARMANSSSSAEVGVRIRATSDLGADVVLAEMVARTGGSSYQPVWSEFMYVQVSALGTYTFELQYMTTGNRWTTAYISATSLEVLEIKQ